MGDPGRLSQRDIYFSLMKESIRFLMEVAVNVSNDDPDL